MLTRMGHRPQLAADGDEALRLISQGRFDVVLMDIKMPNRDGLHTTHAIRDLGTAQSKIPIIAMTASVSRDAREMVFESGMDDFISKPISRQVLADALSRWKDRFAEQVEADTRTADAPVKDAAAPEPPSDSGDPVRNRAAQSEIEQALGPEAYHTLMVNFREMLNAKLDRVAANLQAGDVAAATTLVHSIKGSATNLGFTALGLRLKEMEAQLRSNPSGNGVELYLGQVRDAARAIIVAR